MCTKMLMQFHEGAFKKCKLMQTELKFGGNEKLRDTKIHRFMHPM